MRSSRVIVPNDNKVWNSSKMYSHKLLPAFVTVIVLFLYPKTTTCQVAEPRYDVHYFSAPNEKIDSPIQDPADNLAIFCYEGEDKNWLNIWKTVGVQFSFQNDVYEVFQGSNESDVDNSYRQSYSLFHILPWKTKLVDMSVYTKSCIGVYSERPFTAILEVNYINFWKVSRLFFGLGLYYTALQLSSNIIFYYTSGVALGITASLLILVYFISRLVPRKVGALSVLIGGWTMVLYALQLLITNLKVIVIQHQNYVVAYLTVVGFVSFAVCYKYGTVDKRTQNLIKWLLQGIGLLLVFLSTEWKEVATSIILIVLTVDKCPPKWKSKCQTFWRRRFPPKVKLLSEEEYHQQCFLETKKALQSLREYCNSPNCKSWKVMQKLKSPLRFAQFVEGESHLSNDEVLNYELDESFNMDDEVDGNLISEDDDDSFYNARTTVI